MKKVFYFLIFVVLFLCPCVSTYGQATRCDSLEISFPQQFISPVTCYGDSNGRAIVSTNYPVNSYVWDNGVTTSHNSFLHTGYNSVTVHLVGGCFKTDSVFIAGPDPLSVTLSTNVTNCTNGHIIIDSIFGGTFPYDIEWSNGSNAYSISNITLDSAYSYEITDIRGCKITDTVIIPSTVPINASISKRQVSCYGNANGQLITNVSGGASPYIYHWNNGATNSIIDNLVAGEYSVIVTDANGCTFTITDTIKQPSELRIDSYYIINANCNDSLGSICVDVQGGIWPYNFSWNGDSLNDFWCLHDSPGLYDLRVTDGNGCVVTHLFTIGTDPNPIAQITITPDNEICYGDSVTIYVDGGVSYQWNDGNFNQTVTKKPLSDSIYSVIVADSNGCKDTAMINVAVHQLLNSVTTFIINCTQGCAQVSTTGGVAPYSYVWSNGSTSQFVTNLQLDSVYTLEVVDATGCSKIDTIIIHSNQTFGIGLISQTSVSCHGGSNGSATVAATGGNGNISYHWSNGISGPMNNNLSAGIYTVTAMDGDGCVATSNVTISEPAELSVDTIYFVNANCNNSNGSIDIHMTGGTLPYTYEWNNDPMQNTSCFHGPQGFYEISITDANGCNYTDHLPILLSSNPTAHITTSSTQICAGDIVTLTAIGGVSYHWNNGSITQTLMDNPTISTTYKVTVTDVNGCSDTDSIYVHVNEVIADIIASDSQVCLGDNITLAATGGISYYWSTGETSSIIVKTPNQTTTYVVTVTDANGCSDTDSVNVIVNQVVANITASSTSITAGTPVVLSSDIADEYTWSTGETLQTIVVYPTVTTQYSLVVRTGNCTDITSITINVVNSTDPDDPNDPNNPTTILPLNFELGDLHYVCYNHDPIVLQNYVNIDLSHGGQVNFVGPGVAGGIFYPSSVGPAGTFQIMAFYADPITHQEYQGAQSITVQPGTTLDWILNQSVVYLYSQPFVLTGAQPLGGVYSGNGVIPDNGVYYFDPAVAGLGNHTLTYTYTNEWGCESVTSKMISVSSQTGIDDVLDTDISVYPNPVNSVLNISLNKNISDILLIDMLGRLVEQQQVYGQSKIQINMDTYSNGIYLLRFVSQDGQITTKKVIKQ